MTDDREKLIRQDGLLIGIAGASLLSGMHFSPFFDPAFVPNLDGRHVKPETHAMARV